MSKEILRPAAQPAEQWETSPKDGEQWETSPKPAAQPAVPVAPACCNSEDLKLFLEAFQTSNKLEHLVDRKLLAKATARVKALLSATPAAQPVGEPVAWLFTCQKRPDLKQLSFAQRRDDLTVRGYKSRPLVFGDTTHQSVPAREPVTPAVFDLICAAIDKADTISMEGDYMLDSNDCIRVVRTMQVLLDICAHHKIGGAA